MPGDVRAVLDLDVPSDVRLIEQIVALVSRQIRALDFPARVCSFNVPVALREALSNAMLRGNHDDRAKHVRIRVWADTDQVVLDVGDEGEGFDLERCTRDPTTADNVVREDGRGLFLMRRLMDRVESIAGTPTGANGGDQGKAGNVVRLTLRPR
jgi:serine/threonine-protein kinase RsbW